MKYIAILDTDDFKDFEFFEDGNGKYLHAVDAGAVKGEWIYLPFKPLEQQPCEDVVIDKNYWKGFNNGIRTEKFRESKRQEPCADAISRQAVNTLVDELARAISDERGCMSRG